MKKNKVLSISCFPSENFKQPRSSFPNKKFSFSPTNKSTQNNSILSFIGQSTQPKKNEQTLINLSRVKMINPLNHLKHPSFDFNLHHSLSPTINSANQTGKKTKSKLFFKLSNKKPNIPYPKPKSRNKLPKIETNTLIFQNSIIKEAIDNRKMRKLWKNALIGENEVTMVQIRNPSLNLRCNKRMHFKDKLKHLSIDGYIDNNFMRNIGILKIKL